MINPSIANMTQTDESAEVATLQVDVIADLVCPWCYLGKHRLDDALSAVHGPSVVNWFPFQLNPGMPTLGMPFDEYLANKFGDVNTVQPGLDYLTQAGEAEGIHFRFDRIERVPGTLDVAGLAAADDKGIAWEDLSQEQRQLLQRFEGDWESFAADRQQRLSNGASRWAGMTPEQRGAAQGRFRQWRDLPPDRQQSVRDRYSMYRDMSPAERRRIQQNYVRFRQLQNERRKRLHDKFRSMTPAQRDRLRKRMTDRRPKPAARD